MTESRRTACWTMTTLKGKVAQDLQKVIRLEAADAHGYCVCVTCGDRDHYKLMDAGHFVSGRSNGVLFDERNIHVQCKHCNRHRSGNQEAYAGFMLAMYSRDIIDEIKANRHKTYKTSREELLAMRDGYRQRIKDQEHRIARGETREDAQSGK